MTVSQRSSVSARSHVSRISVSSRSRPTKGVSCRRSGASPTCTSRWAATGSAFPFNSSGATGSTSIASRTSASVGSPSSTSRGFAACSRRAATLTASPVQAFLGAGDDHAGVEPDAGLESELGKRIAHFRRCPDRAQRVVLVRGRHAEDRHDRIADELLDRSAVSLDDCPHPLEVANEQRTKRLRIDRLTERGRAGDVAEQDGDRLAKHLPMISLGVSARAGSRTIRRRQRRTRGTAGSARPSSGPRGRPARRGT